MASSSRPRLVSAATAADAQPVTGNKRLSLTNKLDNVISGKEDAFLFIREAEAEEIEARGFRHLAIRTQKVQDRDLRIYLEIVRVLNLPTSESATDEELDEMAFPADVHLLYKYLRIYVMQAFKLMEPRALALGRSVQYNSLLHYRKSMLFWVPRKYIQKNMQPPPRAIIFSQMVESMRWVQRKYGALGVTEAKKSFLGLQELRQLIDYEMAVTPCIELSEQHQAAWCIGRITCVRPSSIGPSKYRTDCLRWSDLVFTRTSTKGEFKVVITFRNLKTNRDDPEQGLGKALECHIKCPSVQNIIFSPAHRLLTIALRRNLLVNATTIEELFESKNHYVTIKDEHIHDPVFYKGRYRGLSLDKKMPLNSTGLSAYLRDRGVAMGYEQNISFYSIRRRSATDSVRRIGLEKTRELMGHEPDSRTLEEYYLATRPTVDITGVMLEQAIGSEGYSEEMMKEWSPLALNRLSRERITRTQGQALNALTMTLITQDTECPKEMSSHEIRLYRRRMRRRALAILLSEEHKQQKSNMTQKDFESRLQLAQASDFANAILCRVDDSRANPKQEQEDDQTLHTSGANDIDFDQEFPENDMPEQDVEGAIDDAQNLNVVECELQVDEENSNDIVNDGDALAYHEAAYHMMSILLDNDLTQARWWADKEKTCPLCREDATVESTDKDKQWDKQYSLNRHMQGSFHSLKEKWRRRRRQIHNDFEGDKWLCPYCGDKSYRYSSLRRVEQHIVTSTEKSTSVEHEELKALDGWMNEDFAGYISEAYQAEKRKALFLEIGLEEYTPNRHRERAKPIPHATLHGVWHGDAFTTDDALKAHPGILTEVPQAGLTSDAILERFKGLISTEPISMSSDEILKYWPEYVSVAKESKTDRKVKRWRRRSGLDPDS